MLVKEDDEERLHQFYGNKPLCKRLKKRAPALNEEEDEDRLERFFRKESNYEWCGIQVGIFDDYILPCLEAGRYYYVVNRFWDMHHDEYDSYAMRRPCRITKLRRLKEGLKILCEELARVFRDRDSREAL